MKGRIFIFALIVAAILGAVYVVECRATGRWRKENDVLRHQLEEARLASSKVANSSPHADNGLTQTQFSELLRLRAEVTQLLAQTNDMATLREENEKLQAQASIPNNAGENTNSEPGEEIHERDSWAFAGYNTPENAFQSFFWAFSQTNKEALLASFDFNSDTYAEILKDTNFEEHVSQDSSKLRSFKFTGPAKMFGGFSVVSVFVDDGSDPSTETHDMLFKKNGDSWQVIGAH